MGAARLVRILWLDGRPGSIRLVRSYRWLLEAQGFVVHVPRSLPGGGWDVIVAPPPGDPLHFRVVEEASRFRAKVVWDERPRRALFKALYRMLGFREAGVGIDPGVMCAAAAVAGGLVIWLWKGECVDLPGEVELLAEDLPGVNVRVYVGSGAGLPMAGEPVPEAGSTSRPYRLPGALEGAVRDRDLLAAVTIAFRGLARGTPRT